MEPKESVSVKDCILYMFGDSSYCDRLEEMALEGRVALDGSTMQDCAKLRLSWTKGHLNEFPFDIEIRFGGKDDSWCPPENAGKAGIRWFKIGSDPVLARILLYIGSKYGDSEAMLYLGYMIRMRLGEFWYGDNECPKSVLFAPGSERSGMSWIEESVRKGCAEAKEYLDKQVVAGDLESRAAMARLSIGGQ